MKTIVAALIALTGLTATAATQTVIECRHGESAETQCIKVTYKVRQPSATQPQEEVCNRIIFAAGDSQTVCYPSYGVPNWLRKLSEAFGGVATDIPVGNENSPGA